MNVAKGSPGALQGRPVHLLENYPRHAQGGPDGTDGYSRLGRDHDVRTKLPRHLQQPQIPLHQFLRHPGDSRGSSADANVGDAERRQKLDRHVLVSGGDQHLVPLALELPDQVLEKVHVDRMRDVDQGPHC